MFDDLVSILLLAIAVPLVAVVAFRNIARSKRRSRRPVHNYR